MRFIQCKECGEYGFSDTHKCKPLWEAIYLDYHDEDDPQKVFGFEAETAAERFVESNFANWDYPEEVEIWIRKPGDTEWQKFEVFVEQVPSFSATRKED